MPGFPDDCMPRRIEIDELDSETVPLEYINLAFEKMHHGDVIRSVIVH